MVELLVLFWVGSECVGLILFLFLISDIFLKLLLFVLFSLVIFNWVIVLLVVCFFEVDDGVDFKVIFLNIFFKVIFVWLLVLELFLLWLFMIVIL